EGRLLSHLREAVPENLGHGFPHSPAHNRSQGIKRMKIGMLTSGGDSPGLNAVIRGAVLKGVLSHNAELVGFRHGWRGLVEEDFVPLDRQAVRGLSKQGGTILGTSRTNPFEGENGGAERI